MAASARALMKSAMADLIWVLVCPTALVASLVKGVALPPPPQTAASLFAHYQWMVVLNHCILLTAFAAACLAINVKGRFSSSTATKEARMLRASVLLALAFSLAAAVLAAATHYYVLQVRMATDFSFLPDAAKATLWAVSAMVWLACAVYHYELAALAVRSKYE